MNKISRYFIFLFITIRLHNVSAQNLVLNWSFESYNQCPDSWPFISSANNWYNPNTGSADYFNSCAPESSGFNVPNNSGGFQFAKDSNAYAGIFAYDSLNPNLREYITGQLSSPLLPGEKYYVSFYVNQPEFFAYSVRTLGAYFSSTAPSVSDFYCWPVTPQIENTGGVISDTMNWYMVNDTFTAVGGEQYITIGNFRPDSLSDTLNTYPGQYAASYYFIDAVTVISYSEVGIGEIKNIRKDILVYLDPESNIINIVQKNPIQNSILEIFSMDGRKMEQFPVIKGLDSQSFHLGHLDTGLYFYSLRSENSILKTGKIILVSRN